MMPRKAVTQRQRHSAAKSWLNESLPCIVPCSCTLVIACEMTGFVYGLVACRTVVRFFYLLCYGRSNGFVSTSAHICAVVFLVQITTPLSLKPPGLHFSLY